MIIRIHTLSITKYTIHNHMTLGLWVLSYTYQKQAQNNTVVISQKEMDRVGVEPTSPARILEMLSDKN